MGDAAASCRPPAFLRLVQLLLAVALFVVSSANTRAPRWSASSLGLRTGAPSGRALERGVDRIVALAAAGRRRDGRAQGVRCVSAMPLAISRRPPEPSCRARGSSLAKAALERWIAPSRSTVAMAIGVELKNRATALRRAGLLGRLLAGRAVERQRARGAGKAVVAIGDAMQQAHRQAQSVAAAKVEVDLLGAHGGGWTLAGSSRAAASLATMSRNASRPSRPGEIEIEPAARVAFI